VNTDKTCSGQFIFLGLINKEGVRRTAGLLYTRNSVSVEGLIWTLELDCVSVSVILLVEIVCLFVCLFACLFVCLFVDSYTGMVSDLWANHDPNGIWNECENFVPLPRELRVTVNSRTGISRKKLKRDCFTAWLKARCFFRIYYFAGKVFCLFRIFVRMVSLYLCHVKLNI